MTPDDLAAAITEAVSACLQAGEFAGSVPSEVVVERPNNPEHGDYATNIALRLAKPAARPAREVAEAVAARLRTCGSSSITSAIEGSLAFCSARPICATSSTVGIRAERLGYAKVPGCREKLWQDALTPLSSPTNLPARS